MKRRMNAPSSNPSSDDEEEKKQLKQIPDIQDLSSFGDDDFSITPTLNRDIPSLDEPVYRGFDMDSGNTAFLAMPGLHQPLGHTYDAMPGFAKPDAMNFSKNDLEMRMNEMSLQDTPPLSMGGYLEPYYHFFSTASSQVIFGQIVAVLRSLHEQPEQHGEIDYVVKDAKFKVKCEAYAPNGSKIPFVVRVFRTEGQGNRFAVEFQRRRGDPTTFNAIYQTCLQKLAGIIEPGSFQTAHPLNDAPVDNSFFVEEQRCTLSTEMSEETVACLMQMIQSKCVDVQSEALNALVPLCKEHHELFDMNYIGVLLDRASSPHEDVHRACLTALATIVEQQPALCTAVVAVSNQRMLIERACSATPHVVRETTRLLLAVCKQVDAFEGQSALMFSLNRAMEAHSDERVRSAWDDIVLRWGG